MADYLCSKCGCHADSKCISQRSVFLDNDMVTICNNVMIQAQEKLHWKDYAREVARLSKTYPEAFVMATCVHDWALQSAECDLGCCKRLEAA